MRVVVYVAIVLAVSVGLAGRLAARWFAPRTAAITLVGAATISAAGWLWSLGLLTATLVDDAPPAAALVGLHMNGDPVPAWVGLAAALLVGVALARCVETAAREVRRARFVHHLLSTCPPDGESDLVVVGDAVPRAFAVPRLARGGGYVVVSSAMLRALDAHQRAVLLAHERSHLRHRHSWFRTIALVAGAAQPLLGRLDRQVGTVLERWADEDAASAVSDRRLAARSLGRAAGATARAGAPPAPRTDHRLSDRITALLTVAPRSSRSPMVALGTVFLLMSLSIGEASHDLEVLFDSGPHPVASASAASPATYYAP